MELDMRKAQPQDLDGLDQVMLVISDAAGERGKVLQLLEHITADPQKYLLVAEDKDTGTICGSLFGVVFEDICDSCRPILLVENVAVLESYQGKAWAGRCSRRLSAGPKRSGTATTRFWPLASTAPGPTSSTTLWVLKK